MTGFNPIIDVAVVTAMFMILGAICVVGHQMDKKRVKARRGATRI